jgi:hypothetical protein
MGLLHVEESLEILQHRRDCGQNCAQQVGAASCYAGEVHYEYLQHTTL